MNSKCKHHGGRCQRVPKAAAAGGGGGGGGGELKLAPVKHDAGLNQRLNDCARNTNDTQRLRALVYEQGADLTSTNGGPWNHTPLHQSAYHNRPEMVRELIELCRARGVLAQVLSMGSNPCGRGGTGTPLDLARGGGHKKCVALLEEAARSPTSGAAARGPTPKTIKVSGAGIWWCNDTWTLAGEQAGRPYWRRNGNRTDCIAWNAGKASWTMSGTPGAGDADVYMCEGDSPLPPRSGWAPRSGGGSFGTSVPKPAPRIEY